MEAWEIIQGAMTEIVNDEKQFDKEVFLKSIKALNDHEFNRFCVELLDLQYTVDTHMNCFTNPGVKDRLCNDQNSSPDNKA